MDWLDDVLKEVDIKDILDKDSELIFDEVGLEVLKKLWEKFPCMMLYISTKPLTRAKKLYIQKYHDGTNSKKLAMLLDVSERFVFQSASEDDPCGRIRDNTSNLFENDEK